MIIGVNAIAQVHHSFLHHDPWHAMMPARPPSHAQGTCTLQLLFFIAQPRMDTREGGERVIAASRRPDGTLRKERKIRPGFVPQEEQQVYVSRGAAVSCFDTRHLHLLVVWQFATGKA
jgi:Mago binding